MKVIFDLDLKRKLSLLYEFKLLYSYDGIKCKSCGLIQGSPNDKLGIRKEYCKHYYNRIRRKTKPINDKLFQEAIKEVMKEISNE